MFTWVEFFTDPILRAPTIGAMMMSLMCALVGVIAFVQRRSLIGETLSHAAYPGIALGGVVGASLGLLPEEGLGWCGILGGGISALIGLFAVESLEKRGTRSWRIDCQSDAADACTVVQGDSRLFIWASRYDAW